MAKGTPAPRAAPPFTGRDLLDQVYGQVFWELHPVACRCSRNTRFMHDSVQEWGCAFCEQRIRDFVEIDHESMIDGPTVNHNGSLFEFFAHRWWKHGKPGFLLGRQFPVTNRELIATLNRKAGFTKPAPAPVAKLQPSLHRYESSRPAKRKPSSSGPKVCSCRPAGVHGLWTDEELAADCEVHGRRCHTCKQIHQFPQD